MAGKRGTREQQPQQPQEQPQEQPEEQPQQPPQQPPQEIEEIEEIEEIRGDSALDGDGGSTLDAEDGEDDDGEDCEDDEEDELASFGDALFDPMLITQQVTQLLVTESGVPLVDVVLGIQEALDKQNKILYKLVSVIEAYAKHHHK